MISKYNVALIMALILLAFGIMIIIWNKKIQGLNDK